MYLRFVFVTLLHFITTIVSVCVAIHSNTTILSLLSFIIIVIILYHYDDSCYFLID